MLTTSAFCQLPIVVSGLKYLLVFFFLPPEFPTDQRSRGTRAERQLPPKQNPRETGTSWPEGGAGLATALDLGLKGPSLTSWLPV